MSGGPDDPKRRTLSAEEVQAFFARIDATDVCPICGNNIWYMATDERYRHFVPALVNELGHQIGVKVYVMICSRCGFVRQHYSGIVEADPPNVTAG